MNTYIVSWDKKRGGVACKCFSRRKSAENYAHKARRTTGAEIRIEVRDEQYRLVRAHYING